VQIVYPPGAARCTRRAPTARQNCVAHPFLVEDDIAARDAVGDLRGCDPRFAGRRAGIKSDAR
jgi:hypothetical protein